MGLLNAVNGSLIFAGGASPPDEEDGGGVGLLGVKVVRVANAIVRYYQM